MYIYIYNVCVYIYIYVCICICIYIYVYVYVCICISLLTGGHFVIFIIDSFVSFFFFLKLVSLIDYVPPFSFKIFHLMSLNLDYFSVIY